MKGARLPKLPKSKTDCPLGTECLLRNFQSVITQCLRQISNALWFRWLQKFLPLWRHSKYKYTYTYTQSKLQTIYHINLLWFPWHTLRPIRRHFLHLCLPLKFFSFCLAVPINICAYLIKYTGCLDICLPKQSSVLFGIASSQFSNS